MYSQFLSDKINDMDHMRISGIEPLKHTLKQLLPALAEQSPHVFGQFRFTD